MRTSDPTRGQHILETAARLFARRHYHEVRMEDVALAAGVAKGTIYRYFHDKDDLYSGLIQASSDRLYAEVKKDIDKAADAEAKLLVFVSASVTFFRRQPYFLELLQRIETTGSREKVAALAASRERFFKLVRAVIGELIGTGKYAASRGDLAAFALTGMTRQILRLHPQPFPPDLPRWIVRQFLHGLHHGVNGQALKNGSHAALSVATRKKKPRRKPRLGVPSRANVGASASR